VPCIDFCACGTERSAEIGSVDHLRCLLARARGRRHDDQQESRTSNLFADGHAGASYGVARDSNPNQQLSSGVHPWPRSLSGSSAASLAVPERSPWSAMSIEIDPHPA
jgi:hypothetical protein